MLGRPRLVCVCLLSVLGSPSALAQAAAAAPVGLEERIAGSFTDSDVDARDIVTLRVERRLPADLYQMPVEAGQVFMVRANADIPFMLQVFDDHHPAPIGAVWRVEPESIRTSPSKPNPTPRRLSS